MGLLDLLHLIFAPLSASAAPLSSLEFIARYFSLFRHKARWSVVYGEISRNNQLRGNRWLKKGAGLAKGREAQGRRVAVSGTPDDAIGSSCTH